MTAHARPRSFPLANNRVPGTADRADTLHDTPQSPPSPPPAYYENTMIPSLPSTPLHLAFLHLPRMRTRPSPNPNHRLRHALSGPALPPPPREPLRFVRGGLPGAAAAMAAGRRLSELLQEQQEPFLVEPAKIRRPRRGRGGGGACCPVAACQRLLRLCNHGFKKRSAGVGGLRSALSKALCGKAAMRSAFRWESGCCFTGVGVGADREFRRLRRPAGDSGECGARAMEFDDDGYGREGAARWEKTDMEVDSSRQLSPVSVLELHSDDDSPVHPRWEEHEKPSTSGSSPSPPSSSSGFDGPTSPCFTYDVRNDKALAMETTPEEEDEETAGNHRGGGGGKSMEDQISSWERIAGDISRIPTMVELDLSEHTRQQQQWRGLGPEVREIGARIETLIFEEIRRETVCDMLASHCTF